MATRVPVTAADRSPLPSAGSVAPSAPAIIIDEHSVVDHGTLRQLVGEMVASLPDVAHGRLLAHVPLRATVDDLVGYLAVLEAGHVALVTSAATEPDQLAAQWAPDLTVSGGRVEVRSASGRPNHLLHPDLALLLSTSGSTGSPKLVRLSHGNLLANAHGISAALQLTSQDRGITSLPLYYCYGLSVLHTHLLVGASIVLSEHSVLDPAFWHLVDRAEVSTIAAVPHMIELMESTGVLEHDHPSLRLITQAGGRMAPQRVLEVAQLGARHGWGLSVMYGQTECTARICIQQPCRVPSMPEAVGQAIPGTTVLLDPTVPEAPHPQAGEVVVRGASVMLGYAEHPDDLALGRMIDELRTGDIGQLDADGTLRIVGRRSSFVKVLGLRIDLSQVEEALAQSGLNTCVTGDDSGVRVAVERQPDHDPAAAERQARDIAAAACGLSVAHVQAAVVRLPRLANGKLDRPGCDRLVRGLAAREQDDPPSSLRLRVRHLLGDILGREEVDLEQSFTALGGDSLSHVQASTKLRMLLGDLPRDWHHQPLTMLIAAADGATSSARTTRRGLGRWSGFVRLDTSVVLRALAVVMICGTHAGLFRLLGGAHALLVVAGFSAAQFGLSAAKSSARWRASARLITGVAIPTMIVAAVGVLYGRYAWSNVVLANWLLGDVDRRYTNELWFMDALVASVLLTTGLLAIPPIARAWRSDPWRVAFGLVLVALVPRFAILHFGSGSIRGLMPTVLWLFAIGLAIAHARTPRRRLLTLAATLVGVATFFPDDPIRNATIFVLVSLLALVGTVPVPRVVVPLITLLAAASLHIYLVQFQIIELVESAALATFAALLIGTALWRLTDVPVRRLADLLVRRPQPITTERPTA